MIDEDDELQGPNEQLALLAALTEEITRRLESGEAVNVAGCPTGADPIHEILPTLRTIVSLGEQLAREKRSKSQSQAKKRKLS